MDEVGRLIQLIERAFASSKCGNRSVDALLPPSSGGESSRGGLTETEQKDSRKKYLLESRQLHSIRVYFFITLGLLTTLAMVIML